MLGFMMLWVGSVCVCVCVCEAPVALMLFSSFPTMSSEIRPEFLCLQPSHKQFIIVQSCLVCELAVFCVS